MYENSNYLVLDRLYIDLQGKAVTNYPIKLCDYVKKV